MISFFMTYARAIVLTTESVNILGLTGFMSV